MVAKRRSPSPEMVTLIGPTTTVPSGSPDRVTTSGRAARRKGAARNAERLVAESGSRATRLPTRMAPQARPMATKAPAGRRLTTRMKARARRTLPRASARWAGLARGT
jgi:hypothetical protein